MPSDIAIHTEDNLDTLLRDAIRSLQEAIDRLRREDTTEAAYRMCRVTRELVRVFVDFRLFNDDPILVALVLEHLHQAQLVLQRASEKNPENREFLRFHKALADRAIMLTRSMSHGSPILGATDRYVFLSYVRENESIARRLRDALDEEGIRTWLDQVMIKPGQRWRDLIRQAIRDGQCFIPLFSTEYCHRDRTYMNEELTVAIEELRQLHFDTVWFIPVVLPDCEVPPIPIGRGETLRDIQYIRLSTKRWKAGVKDLADAIRRATK